eukprot:jgi/Mesvir1/22845/Mv20102-RA.1
MAAPLCFLRRLILTKLIFFLLLAADASGQALLRGAPAGRRLLVPSYRLGARGRMLDEKDAFAKFLKLNPEMSELKAMSKPELRDFISRGGLPKFDHLLDDHLPKADLLHRAALIKQNVQFKDKVHRAISQAITSPTLSAMMPPAETPASKGPSSAAPMIGPAQMLPVKGSAQTPASKGSSQTPSKRGYAQTPVAKRSARAPLTPPRKPPSKAPTQIQHGPPYGPQNRPMPQPRYPGVERAPLRGRFPAGAEGYKSRPGGRYRASSNDHPLYHDAGGYQDPEPPLGHRFITFTKQGAIIRDPSFMAGGRMRWR